MLLNYYTQFSLNIIYIQRLFSKARQKKDPYGNLNVKQG